MVKMWVKPKGKSMVLLEEDEVEMIIKQNAELRSKKEVKKSVSKKKKDKEEKEDGKYRIL